MSVVCVGVHATELRLVVQLIVRSGSRDGRRLWGGTETGEKVGARGARGGV